MQVICVTDYLKEMFRAMRKELFFALADYEDVVRKLIDEKYDELWVEESKKIGKRTDETIGSFLKTHKNPVIEASKEKSWEHIVYNDETMQKICALITEINIMLRAFDNDKVIGVVPIVGNLVRIMAITFTDRNLFSDTVTINKVIAIIGKTIVFDTKQISKDKTKLIDNPKLIAKLATYFNEDGTFKYDADLYSFEEDLRTLVSEDQVNLSAKYLEEFYEFREFDYIRFFIDLFGISLISRTVPQQEKRKEKEDLSFDYVSLKYLHKYYKNGEIIQIPEDIDEFLKRLEDCPISDQEKEFIRKSLKRKGTGKGENYILKGAKELLSRLYPTDKNYWALQELITNLESCMELEKDEISIEEKKILASEEAEITNAIKEIFRECGYEETLSLK